MGQHLHPKQLQEIKKLKHDMQQLGHKVVRHLANHCQLHEKVTEGSHYGNTDRRLTILEFKLLFSSKSIHWYSSENNIQHKVIFLFDITNFPKVTIQNISIEHHNPITSEKFTEIFKKTLSDFPRLKKHPVMEIKKY